MIYFSHSISKLNLQWVVIGWAVLLLSGCDPNHADTAPGVLRLDVSLLWNGTPFVLGNVVADHMEHAVRLDNLQMYWSQLELRDDNGDWHSAEDVHLLDFINHDLFVRDSIKCGTYDALRFGMGIPPELNIDIDPASYPNDHPLSVSGSAGMFWTWSSGYVFVKYEGKVAESLGQQLIDPLSYHCGTDASYRSVTLELAAPLEIKSAEITVINIAFDAALALTGEDDQIDVIEEPVTHNSEGTILGERLMDLMDDAWSIQP